MSTLRSWPDSLPRPGRSPRTRRGYVIAASILLPVSVLAAALTLLLWFMARLPSGSPYESPVLLYALTAFPLGTFAIAAAATAAVFGLLGPIRLGARLAVFVLSAAVAVTVAGLLATLL